MNYEFFVARRIAFSRVKDTMVSRPIIRIALAGMALGFAVMLIAICVVTGFKKEISDKVIGFGSHIQVSHFDENNSYETTPILLDSTFSRKTLKDDNIKHIQVFATKAGIIKTERDIEGVIAKGVGRDYDWDYFRSTLISGRTFSINDSVRSDSVLISENTAMRLNLKPGDYFIMHFIQQPPRARKFRVGGIYKTGLEEFDNLYIFCDIGHIQKLNDWKNGEIGGLEITVRDFSRLDETASKLYQSTASDLNTKTVKELYPQIFDWLNLQDVNAVIIIGLMIVVCGMNMISALLIIILERISLIGTLKAMGSRSAGIRKIFLWLSAYLIGRGMLWGNLIGLAILFTQKKFGWLRLDQQSYYISYVPVHFSPANIILLNTGTLLVCVAMMILPTLIITRIRPISAIRYV